MYSFQSFSFYRGRGESMRARTILALCVVVCGALLTGCASGHKTFAYVVGQGTNEVFEFRAEPNGKLTPLGQPNFPAGSNPSALAPHTSGDFLYVADFSGNDVTLLDINRSSGNLSVPVSTSVVTPVTPPNIFPAGTGPIAAAVSPAHPFLFVANQSSGDIFAYTVDPGTGSLATVQGAPFPIAPASNPTAMAISPKGDFLFVACAAQATVAAFAIGSSGGLTAVPGSPFSMGSGATPVSVTVERTGRFLYVADPAHNTVLGFSIASNGSLGAVTGSPFSAGALPSAVAADPQGSLLFAANTGSNNVSAYVIDKNSGALGQVTGSPFATGGQGPSALAVDPESTVLYVTDAVSHDVAALAIQTNGALKPVAGSPFGVATAGTAIVLVRE
jgi:6-phosphogluconolactonase